MVSVSDVRVTIGIDNESVLSADRINLAITDATALAGTTDEIALRYYTCYLIAQEWDTINATSAVEGVTFRIPDPQRFLDLFDRRVKQLTIASGNQAGMAKTSLNKDFVYDRTDFEIRPRRGGDPEA